MATFASPDDLPRPAGYSQAVSIPAGRLVWTSGQLPLDADRNLADGWAAQARAVFENLGRALAAADASWPDVVKLTIYVVDLEGLEEIRRVRDEFVNTAAPPTSSLVQVAGLAQPGALLEVEAVAHVADPTD
ncbi:MAG TPA: RidA family protein [Gaiellaceae bacterium]|nr:RidA family protein [Gaiellaceae bacterium]